MKHLVSRLVFWGCICALLSGCGDAESDDPSATCPTAIVSDFEPRDPETDVGDVTQYNVCLTNGGTVERMTLRYQMGSFFGEPTRRAVFAYEAGFEINDAVWFAQVFSPNGQPYQVNQRELHVGWSEGLWPDPGGEFGEDTTGSPFWPKVFGYLEQGELVFDLTEEEAKDVYRNGFYLDRLQVVKVNDVDVVY